MIDDRTLEIYNLYLTTIESIVNKKSEMLISWIKNIITLLVGLISVLVAFKSDKQEPEFIHLLFSLTLILLGISVLSGVVSLYNEIDRLSWHLSFQQESLKIKLSGDDQIHYFCSKDKNIFVFFSLLFYITSLASLISLICYGILKT